MAHVVTVPVLWQIKSIQVDNIALPQNIQGFWEVMIWKEGRVATK